MIYLYVLSAPLILLAFGIVVALGAIVAQWEEQIIGSFLFMQY